MGAGLSRYDKLSSNEALCRFVSPEALPPDHPFWNTFLSFNMRLPKTRDEWKGLDENSEELLKRFAVNNTKSGNFGSLIRVFITRISELEPTLAEESTVFVWQTFNALFVIRIVSKFFSERLKEDEFYRQFTCSSKDKKEVETEAQEENLLEKLMRSLVEAFIALPNKDQTYGLLCEILNTLIVLLSTPMFSQAATFQMKTFRIMMSVDNAKPFIEKLINNYMQLQPAPPTDEGGSLVIGIASGIWNVLTLGYGNVASSATEEKDFFEPYPLAESSLLLMLILINHCVDSKTITNPFRLALFNSRHSKSKGQESAEEKTNVEENITIDFAQLFKTICDSLSTDESTMLLYSLVHQNLSFRSYALASSDIDKVIIPILKTLYSAPESSSHHIYMSLIVMLILSEDDLFNSSIHDMHLKNVEWYSERALQDISLGGLLILVVIRTIQYNLLKTRDKYLHTNCLAALANMSGQFKDLSPYVCQRILSMFEALSKRYYRQVELLKNNEDKEVDGEFAIGEAMNDVTVLEEVLRMILEIINSCLVHQMKSNFNLIYALLYRKDLIEPLGSHHVFQDLSQNLQIIIRYFSSKLEQVQEKKDRTLAVEEVQEVIRQAIMQFPKEKLTKFPDLKFKYVEEEQPEDFFVPYVWSLVIRRKMHWNPAYLKMEELKAS